MKFKKLSCIVIAFLLLVSNVGFAFSVHYCDDAIASISLNTTKPVAISEENCCGIIEQKSHCCKDKVVVIQKKSDQAIVKSFSLQSNDVVLQQQWTPVFFSVNLPLESKNTPAYYCDSHAPPLFKLYSQYLFYDRF